MALIRVACVLLLGPLVAAVAVGASLAAVALERREGPR